VNRTPLREAAVDVLVAGAGPAGCAAAAAASRAGATVALLDGRPDSAAPGRPDFRVGEGAAPGTPELIDEVFGSGSEAFTPDAHVRCPSIVSAWGGSRPSVTEHLGNPLGVAWNLDRRRFDADLRAAAQRLGAGLHRCAKVSAARHEATGWTVAFSGPEREAALRARMVIDASGRGARVARLQGVRKHHLDRLVGLWAVWSVDDHDQGSSTFVEATANGWWYSVLLGAQRRIVVHLTDADLLPTGRLERDQLAASATGLDLIGSVLRQSAAPRIVFGPKQTSARSGWLDRFGGQAWLSAGDAAATFDPLSGRGITAALLTGRGAGLAAAALLDGDEETLEGHEDALGRILVDGIQQRQDAYRAEQRWSGAEFWSRRQQLPDEIWQMMPVGSSDPLKPAPRAIS